MNFVELYESCLEGKSRASFAERSGMSTRMWSYVVSGQRGLSINVWRAMIAACPERAEEINGWWLENVICS